MDENTRLADKINSQLNEFARQISKGLPKPKRKFIYQMLFGIQAACDIKLSEISRNLEEEIKLIKTENRLSRNIRDKELSSHINMSLIKQAQGKFDRDTVLALDLTAVEKAYAKKMDYLAKVWDGMDKEPVHGYWVLEVVGANINDDYLLPLYSELYSSDAEGFQSENKQILKAIDAVNTYAQGKGIWTIDRGGDRKELINSMLSRDLRFIIRIKLNRTLTLGNNQKKLALETANSYINYLHNYEVEIDKQGFKEKIKVSLGTKKVKISGVDKELNLVVVKGFGKLPMLLLTNLDKNPILILEMYLTRWKVEESIRFLKQEYHLEDIRVRNYYSLKNTVSLLSAVFYFLSVYLGRKLKLNILLKKICEKAKRFFQIPVFNQYSLADGIYKILFNTKWKNPWQAKNDKISNNQLILSFMQS